MRVPLPAWRIVAPLDYGSGAGFAAGKSLSMLARGSMRHRQQNPQPNCAELSGEWNQAIVELALIASVACWPLCAWLAVTSHAQQAQISPKPLHTMPIRRDRDYDDIDFLTDT
jgi:hypothetical protein